MNTSTETVHFSQCGPTTHGVELVCLLKYSRCRRLLERSMGEAERASAMFLPLDASGRTVTTGQHEPYRATTAMRVLALIVETNEHLITDECIYEIASRSHIAVAVNHEIGFVKDFHRTSQCLSRENRTACSEKSVGMICAPDCYPLPLPFQSPKAFAFGYSCATHGTKSAADDYSNS